MIEMQAFVLYTRYTYWCISYSLRGVLLPAVHYGPSYYRSEPVFHQPKSEIINNLLFAVRYKVNIGSYVPRGREKPLGQEHVRYSRTYVLA